MASYRELSELATDPVRVRSLASKILAMYGPELTDWESEFLGSMEGFDGADPLSTRRREKLVEIRDDYERLTKVGHFSTALLLKNCWLARCDLSSDEDVDFIERLRASGETALRRSQVRRLLRCARELNVVEGYISLGD